MFRLIRVFVASANVCRLDAIWSGKVKTNQKFHCFKLTFRKFVVFLLNYRHRTSNETSNVEKRHVLGCSLSIGTMFNYFLLQCFDKCSSMCQGHFDDLAMGVAADWLSPLRLYLRTCSSKHLKKMALGNFMCRTASAKFYAHALPSFLSCACSGLWRVLWAGVSKTAALPGLSSALSLGWSSGLTMRTCCAFSTVILMIWILRIRTTGVFMRSRVLMFPFLGGTSMFPLMLSWATRRNWGLRPVALCRCCTLAVWNASIESFEVAYRPLFLDG